MLTVSGSSGTVCCTSWAISTILVSEEKRVIHLYAKEITVGMIPRPKATVWMDSGFLGLVLSAVILKSLIVKQTLGARHRDRYHRWAHH